MGFIFNLLLFAWPLLEVGWREVAHCNTIVYIGIAVEFETAYTFGELYNYFQMPHLNHTWEGTEYSDSDQEATVHQAAGKPDGCLYTLKPKLSLKSKHI